MNSRTTLMVARSRAEAQVVEALLQSAGIPVYVPGLLLQDDFAVSQRAMGLLGVKVEVPKTDLERAKQILAEAREKARSEEPD